MSMNSYSLDPEKVMEILQTGHQLHADVREAFVRYIDAQTYLVRAFVRLNDEVYEAGTRDIERKRIAFDLEEHGEPSS